MPPPNAPIQIVWLRRDLRIEDHDGLHQAVRRGPVVPLYIVEPAWLADATFGTRHWTFVRECLAHLDIALRDLGQPLRVRVGEPVSVLAALVDEIAADAGAAADGEVRTIVGGLWATTELGRRAAERDVRVAAWAAAQGIAWHAAAPDDGLARTAVPRPSRLGGGRTAHVAAGELPTAAALGLASDGLVDRSLDDDGDGWLAESGRRRVAGGTAAGATLLASYLSVRGRDHAAAADDPSAAPIVGSRIGAHLAWGALAPSAAHAGLRGAEQERARRANHPASPEHAAEDEAWRASLALFGEGLAARGHNHARFSAQPDLEPDAETTSERPEEADVDPASDATTRLDAWAAGATGRPLVDAAMRQLRAIGWLPYRLRAIVVSFAVHDLGLAWPSVGRRLASLCLDYDPAILWPIVRRIAGALDGSGPRIYNIDRQALSLDPEGTYVRAWLPALVDVPVSFVHSPWLMPPPMQAAARCVVGVDVSPPLATVRGGRAGGRAAPGAAPGTAEDGGDETPRQLPLGG